MFTEPHSQQLKIDFKFWRAIEQTAGRSFPDDTEEVFRLMAVRAAEYGALAGARSSWTRAAKELAAEGLIRLKKPAAILQPIPATFESEVNAMSSTELRLKLNREPAFADVYGRWAAGEKAEGSVAEQEPQLTAAQYHAIPAATICKKYAASPDFRRQVDVLISRGEI